MQGFLSFDGQTIQLSNHEVHHIIGVTLIVNATQVPRPSPTVMLEGEQHLLHQRMNKLDDEKWIASSLFLNELRQRGDALRFAVKSIRNQPSQILTG